MKKQLSLILTSLALAFSVGAISYSKKADKAVEPADAAIVIDQPTDRNDYSVCETYYNSNNPTYLLQALRDVTAFGSADSYDDLWTTYTKAYVKDNQGHIFDYYSNITNYTSSSSHSANAYEGAGYNREHSIPKSWWGGAQTNQGADPFIVVPTDCRINNFRSNYTFGMVDPNKIDTSKSSSGLFSKYGTSLSSWGYDGTVFEPNDSLKGDFARIYFYAIAKYSGSYGWTTGDGSINFSGNSSTNHGLTNYAVKLFSYWSNLDPVSEWEESVNNALAPIQENRNPFVDHPEYANVLWGTNSGYTQYTHASPSVGITSISKTSASLIQYNSTTISATSSNSGTISWSSSNTSVATVSSATSASGSNVTITGVAAGTATITASITISGTTYSKQCTVTVSATKALSSITVTNAKTAYVIDDSFVKPTVTANYSDSTSATVTNYATFTGYNLSEEGQQTVTVSYTEGNVTKTATYSITVSSSGGSGGGESGSFSGTYNYGNQGTGTGKTWSLTDCSDQSSYWLCPNTGNESVALISGIFTDLTITSNVVITINSGTYGSGSNPSSSTFAIYNSSACTSQVTATQTGTLPTSKTYTNAVYTISLANASSFTNDLAIKITKPGKQIRLVSITVEFDYETQGGSSSPTLSSISLDTSNVQKAFTVNATFTYSGLVVTAHYSDSTSATVTPTSVSTPDMSTTGNKTVTVTYLTVSNTYAITVSNAAATSITATVSKTYYVGETISASDISVKDNFNNDVENFTFANDGYQFTYADAASGGALTNKTFTNAVSGSNLTCSLTVQVQRKERVTPSGSNYSVSYTDLPTTYQTSTTERTAASGIKFIAYNLANYSSKMQFKASGGYFRTTEELSLVSLTINNRETNALTVYGSTNGTSFSQTITGSNDVYDLTGYSYVKVMKNGSGAAYCASLTITVEGGDTAVNLANYVMYEDTNNQCTSKFSVAKDYFEAMSSSERSTFMISNDYVISTARERLLAWATHEGKTITQANGDYVVSAPVNVFIENLSQNSVGIAIVATVSLITAASIGGYFFLKKRKED